MYVLEQLDYEYKVENNGIILTKMNKIRWACIPSHSWAANEFSLNALSIHSSGSFLNEDHDTGFKELHITKIDSF